MVLLMSLCNLMGLISLFCAIYILCHRHIGDLTVISLCCVIHVLSNQSPSTVFVYLMVVSLFCVIYDLW